MTEAAYEIAHHRSSSGRYQFKYWQYDNQGDRTAVNRLPKGTKGRIPDLINTAYRNPGNIRAVYGLVFDLDAHRAEARWLDSSGRLDWPKIASFLAESHAEILRYVSHVVRSTSGKGLAVVIAITPLPIRASTARCQTVALNLQSRLIAFFSSIGIGADPAARGLERDFPNWKDDSKRIYHDETLRRRIERDREPVLATLHQYLNLVEREARRAHRLYPDARAEWKLARLVGWLLGTYEADLAIPSPAFLTGDDVWLATADLQRLTGLSDKFLRRFLKVPPPWLRASFCRSSGWRLSIVIGRSLQWIYPRVETLLATKEQPRAPAAFVAKLKRPECVEDGERNHWITSLALAYKWSGLECERALERIWARAAAIAGAAHSRNCRHARAIVKNIYRRLPHTFGMFAQRELPEWMSDEGEGRNFLNGTSTRRGVAPNAPGLMQGGEFAQPVPQMTLPKLLHFPEKLTMQASSAVPVHVKVPCEATFPAAVGDSKAPVKLVAVRRRQRVAIFDKGELVLCLTRRHFCAAKALEFLARTQRFVGLALALHSPHKKRQENYFAAIDACAIVHSSAKLLGAKQTFAAKLAKWRARTAKADDADCESLSPLSPPPF